MNLRFSNIYYFLLTFRYICFSAHEGGILANVKSKKFSSILCLKRGIEIFLCINIKLRKGHAISKIIFFKYKNIDE